MNDAVQDCDALISCLGNSEVRPWRHSTLYEDTIKVMVQAMRKNSIKRLVCMTTAMLRSKCSWNHLKNYLIDSRNFSLAGLS